VRTVHALPWHGSPQANVAHTTMPQNMVQYHNPNPPADSAHLLLARATYVNREDQAKDVYSWILDSGASQHFANDMLDLKHYKRFLAPKEVYLGDNTVGGPRHPATTDRPIHPYILFLSGLSPILLKTSYPLVFSIELATLFLSKRILYKFDNAASPIQNGIGSQTPFRLTFTESTLTENP
jgi:hypothetical protein